MAKRFLRGSADNAVHSQASEERAGAAFPVRRRESGCAHWLLKLSTPRSISSSRTSRTLVNVERERREPVRQYRQR